MITKSVILDIADCWTSSSFMSIRSIDFFMDGTLVDILDNHSYYATTENGSFSAPVFAFDTSVLKTGIWDYTSWISAGFVITNQRLIIVFNNPVEFNKIVINNGHNSGATTDVGAKNVKITVSSDAITDTTYNAAVANSEVLFDDVFDEHVSSDIEDPQILWNDPASGYGNIIVPLAAINSSGSIDIIGFGALNVFTNISSVLQNTTIGTGRVLPKRIKIHGNYGFVGSLVAPISNIESYGFNTIIGVANLEVKAPSINTYGQITTLGACNIAAKKPSLNMYGSMLVSGVGRLQQPLSSVSSYGYITSFGIGTIEVSIPKLLGVDSRSNEYTIIRYERDRQCH